MAFENVSYGGVLNSAGESWLEGFHCILRALHNADIP